jgi:hypothetical protein
LALPIASSSGAVSWPRHRDPTLVERSRVVALRVVSAVSKYLAAIRNISFCAGVDAFIIYRQLPDLISDPPAFGVTCVIAYDKAARPVSIRYNTVHDTVPFWAFDG